jgi:hypothetical protein
MAQELLVENRIEDGEKVLTEFIKSGFDVAVAFWVLTAEEGLWFLYISSNAVNARKVGDAYGTLVLCLTKMPDAAVSLSHVKLVHPSEPIAREAIAVRDRELARLHHARVPVRFYGKRLGELAIEEAFIYPARIGPMTRDEVRQTVMALLTTSGPAQASTFTFADGHEVQAIPIGLQLKMHQPGRGLQIVLLDPRTDQNQAVAADEVVDIR